MPRTSANQNRRYVKSKLVYIPPLIFNFLLTILAPASLTQLPDNKENQSKNEDEEGYECPSRPESDYVIPAPSTYPVAGYTSLITPAPEDDHQYQKLLKLSTYPAVPPILTNPPPVPPVLNNGNDDIREPPSSLTQTPNNEENRPEEEDEIDEGYEYPSLPESDYVIPAQSTSPAAGYSSLITPAPDEDEHQYQKLLKSSREPSSAT